MRVIVESPFGNKDPNVVLENIKYARRCMRDCFLRGENPYASHLLFTQEGILDDNDPQERQQGIDAGLAWGQFAEKTVVYTDRGISKGMEYGIKNADKARRPIEYRSLGVECLK